MLAIVGVLRVCVGHVNCQFPFWPKDSLWAPGPGSFKVLRLLGAQESDRLVLCWHNRGDFGFAQVVLREVWDHGGGVERYWIL